MGVTAFLSMWISNSAATSIMLPVVLAITDELERYEKELHDKKRATKEASSAINGSDVVHIEQLSNRHSTTDTNFNVNHIEDLEYSRRNETTVEVKGGFRFSTVNIKSSQNKFDDTRKGIVHINLSR